MKNLIFLFVSLAYLNAGAQGSKKITNPDIKEVKIFQSGAQVTRLIKTSVNAGVTTLSIEGLSANIDKNSISVTGTGDIILLSVVHQLNYLNNEKKLTEQTKLEDSLEELQNTKAKIAGLESIYTEEQDLLKANKSVGGANVGVNLDNLQKVDNFFRTKMLELNSKLIDIHNDQKKLAEKETKIKQQLAELNVNKNEPTSTIDVSVSAKAQTNVSLDLTYYVTGAGWTPQYDVRAKDINSPIQLAYKANVFQKTGEQWDDVKLKLSTGNPSQNGTKPTLPNWYLNFYQPPPVNVRGSRAGATEYNIPLIDKGKTTEQKTVTYEDIQTMPVRDVNEIVSVDQNQLSVDFDIAVPYSIPSDGKMHMVDVQSYSIPATYSYFAVPKLDKDAFLVAQLTGWEEFNLLPGMANVYFEGSYIGESVIDPHTTTDTLDLSLGRDKKIIITREKKKDLSSTKFIGNNIEKELNYLITVRNTKKDKINITIEDQLPLTMNNDITVKANEYSGANYDIESGKLTWKLDVPPSSIVEKKLGFAVKYPKGRVVNGL